MERFTDCGTYFTHSSWKAKHGSWLGKVSVRHVQSHLSLRGTWSLFTAVQLTAVQLVLNRSLASQQWGKNNVEHQEKPSVIFISVVYLMLL